MSKFDQRHQVRTPALEGSKIIQPVNSIVPFGSNRPVSQGGGKMSGPFYRGYPGGGGYPLPPIGGGGYPYVNVMPAERISVPTILQRPRIPYSGPPSVMPYWGGYSIAGQYHPGKKKMEDSTSGPKVIPVPIRVPRYQPPPPPVVVRQPPPPLVRPIPVIIRRQLPPPPVIVRDPPRIPKKPVNNKTRSVPRSQALERFRRAAHVAFFVALLKEKLKKNVQNRPSSMFLFGIILKEIVAALHRIYLNPNGNIYPVLNDIIGPNCYDLAMLVHGGCKDAREESVLIQELQYVVENVIYHITEIMPSTGVLGTHRKSAVFELIRNGKRFPEGYFWQVEMDRLQFTENGRTVNIGDMESFLLMLGIFISRSLVTTILLKPVDYGLSSEPLSDIAERNLRIVASTILFLVRRIAVTRGQGIMDMPAEIAKYLYSDQEMQHIYSRLSRTFNYCEGLLREWGTEYVRRLNASINEDYTRTQTRA